jgi:hypothetical protein
MKVRNPETDADEHAETQSRQRQPDRVISAEDDAYQKLAAQIAGKRLVDLAHQASHGVALPQRYQIVERCYDAVPVAEQVESHDRRDDEQREQRKKRLALGQQGRQHVGQIRKGFVNQRLADQSPAPRCCR